MNRRMKIFWSLLATTVIVLCFVRLPAMPAGAVALAILLFRAVKDWRSGLVSGLETLWMLLLVGGVVTWFCLRENYESWQAKPAGLIFLFLAPGLLLYSAYLYKELSKWRSSRSSSAPAP